MFIVWPVKRGSVPSRLETLTDLGSRGVKSYIGSCCRPFYVKHQKDFETAGLPGILIDIENTTCYELGEEKEAYAGNFEGQTQLNLGLIKKVMEAREIN